MRARTLGRWLGRLVAIAAFGVGAVLSVPFAASADEPSSQGADAAEKAGEDDGSSSSGATVTPNDFQWE